MKATIHVHVKLFSRFREHLPPEARGEATLELPEGATVDQLVTRLGITLRVKLLAINDEREDDFARVLRDGDQVRIFPVAHGG